LKSQKTLIPDGLVLGEAYRVATTSTGVHYRYGFNGKESKKDDSEVILALQELAFAHPSYGFRKLFAYLRRGGREWNHKKVYRVYKLLKLLTAYTRY
jgi:hypothetical protein